MTGFEVIDLEPEFKAAGHPRAAVRFDYKLRADFILERDGQAWVFRSGTIVEAAASVSDMHLPSDTWEVKAFECQGCDRVSTAKTLRGEIQPGGSLALVGHVPALGHGGSPSRVVHADAGLR